MPSAARLAHAAGVYAVTRCPSCPARRDQPCLSGPGQVRSLPHDRRVDVYRALIYPGMAPMGAA